MTLETVARALRLTPSEVRQALAAGIAHAKRDEHGEPTFTLAQLRAFRAELTIH